MDIKNIKKSLSLEEKAALCSGEGSWSTKAFLQKGIPAIIMTDGPCGVRRQKPDKKGTFPATCFPAPCLTASSFDTGLLYEIGQVMGQECRALGVSLLLAPGINLKRSPLGGRNFEYYSEDPFLSGMLAAAFIQGVQSVGVGAVVKHFALNNQENWRLVSDSQVDEETMRNFYLKSFEIAIKRGKPTAVMTSYNRINGTYASEHEGLLTDLLRKEWGFEGLVISDWGAVNDRVAGLHAGMDFEMPGSANVNDPQIVEAVREGKLPERILDISVERILHMVERTMPVEGEVPLLDEEKGHALACKAAAQSMVLLENNGILPLSDRAAVIGHLAEKPHFQGGGSSHVNPTREESFLEVCARNGEMPAYEPGVSFEGEEKAQQLLEQAVRLAGKSEKVLLFLGLTAADESEGFDRKTMDLPENQIRLAEEVLEANPNTVIVVMAGGVLNLPFAEKAAAILYVYLGGQGGMSALYDLIFGRISPGGKLAESFPFHIEDTPCAPWFGQQDTLYGEKGEIGYRYYDKQDSDRKVRWPFGHGLTYTRFELSDVSVQKEEANIRVDGILKNVGNMSAAQVVQVYLTIPGETTHRLVGFWKKELSPEQKETFSVVIEDDRLVAFREGTGSLEWIGGSYLVEVGFSSRDICFSTEIMLEMHTKRPVIARLGDSGKLCSRTKRRGFHANSTVTDLLGTPIGDLLYKRLLQQLQEQLEKGECDENFYHMYLAQIRQYPLRTFVLATHGAFSFAMLERLLELLSDPEPDMEEAKSLLRIIRVI